MNNKGFTLMEIIVAMIVVGILSAGGLMVYNGLIASSSATSAAKALTQLESAANSYAQLNGGSYAGISPSVLQENELLPASWTVSGNWAVPKNANELVQSYYIGTGQSVWGVTGSYIIGINAPSMTNAQALSICNALENSIDSIGVDGVSYNLPQYNCAGVIPDNRNIIAGNGLFFGF
ncbi:MAG: type II secretion system protein [bacterium]